MKRRLSTLYYVIPVVYLGVILLLVYLQFRGKESFEERVGNLTVTGKTYSRGILGKGGPTDLKVSLDGLSIFFSPRSPLIARFEQDLQSVDRRLRLSSYSVFAGGLELEFGQDLVLRLGLDGTLGDRVTVTPIFPEGGVRPAALSIPYRLTEGKLQRVQGLPLARLTGRLGTLYVALPPGSDIEEQRQRFLLSLADGQVASLSFERFRQQDIGPYEYWFTREGPQVGQAEYQAGVRRYAEEAYRSLGERIGAGLEDGEDVEAIGVAYLSASLPRGDYRRALAVYARALRAYTQRVAGPPLPYRTTPFLGSLSNYLRRRQEEAVRQTASLTDRLRRGEAGVFETPGLMRLVLDHAAFSLAEEMLRLADRVDAAGASLSTVLGLVELYLEADRWMEPGTAVRERARQLIDERLLPAVWRVSSGLFLTQEAGVRRVDMEASLRAGRVLLLAAERLSKPLLGRIGRTLILSALSLSDGSGALPAGGTVRDGQLERDPQTLAPERVYPLVATGYLPEETPLYRQLLPGSWLWSCAPTQVEAAESQVRLTFTFPEGEAHYLIVQGIREPVSVTMHEIPWKPDPQYFRYSDGWWYQADSQTLYVKITHRQSAEELVVGY